MDIAAIQPAPGSIQPALGSILPVHGNPVHDNPVHGNPVHGKPGRLMSRTGPQRLLVAEVPDWPVTAAGQPSVAAAVVAGNRVIAASVAARAEGVREGLRQREAQRRCPELLVIPADLGRDARAWESAVAAVEALTPGVEVLGPGRVALATRGPSRYFGGDRALGERVAAAVERCRGSNGGGGVTITRARSERIGNNRVLFIA